MSETAVSEYSEYEYTLQYPVYTLDKVELLPAGATLTRETLDELSTSGRDVRSGTFSLLAHGSIKNDILEFLSQPPYRSIFSNREHVASMLEVMVNARLKSPVLESMDYFKQEDFYTYRHMLLVFALSVLLGQELLKKDLDIMKGALASPAHDFGKICIPLEILKKTNPLTRTERQILEHHTLAGYVLLGYYNANKLSARIARDHHERNNGSGYPKGIFLRDRLVEIVVVSDIYDALISPRPYRPDSYENRAALEEICEQAKRGELSWDVVKVLVAYNRKDKPHYHECTLSREKRGNPPIDNTYGVIAKNEDHQIPGRVND